MSALNKVPKDALILACDSRKALLITNTGTPIHPKLLVEQHFETEGASGGATGDNPSGSRYDGGGTGGSFRARSAMEAKDPEIGKVENFATDIIVKLSSYLENNRVRQLVVVAPPAFLGVLRIKYNNQIKSMILCEVAKDVVHKPIDEIQATLIDGW